MNRKTALLVYTSVLLLSFIGIGSRFIQPVKASGTIYIRADGSIDPDTAPITSLDNVTYTFTDNINGSIVVERDNIVVDGENNTLHGTGNETGIGVLLSNGLNITITNIEIRSFEYGIYLWNTNRSRIIKNNITENGMGMMVYPHSCHNIITENKITKHHYGDGIREGYHSDNNTI